MVSSHARHLGASPLTPAQNSLFNSALKQSSQLRTDLDAFAASPISAPPALQGMDHYWLSLFHLHSAGQISATIASFYRTLEDYSDTAKKELNSAKQEKARDRIKAFRAELQDYRQRFDTIKRSRDEAVRIM